MSSEDEDEDFAGQIMGLRSALRSNPFNYDAHLGLISVLRKTGELEQLRHARHKMKEVYPLTEAMWLEWVQDEISVCGDARAKAKVIALFEAGIQDYICPSLWIEYAKFVGKPGDDDMRDPSVVPEARAIYERAVSAVGQHYSQGAAMWQAFHQFELEVLAAALAAEAEPTEPQQKRVGDVLRRWMATPVDDGELVDQLVTEWHAGLGQEVDKSFTAKKEGADNVRARYAELEAALAAAAAAADPVALLAAYKAYIEHELASKTATPDRVRLIYERAIGDNALQPELWSGYAGYLDKRGGEACIGVHDRAVRNCPWELELWLAYLRAAEREKLSPQAVAVIFDRAVQAGTGKVSGCPWFAVQFVSVWARYAELHFRKVLRQSVGSEARETAIKAWRTVLDRASVHLATLGPGADEGAHLAQYRARMEATVLQNMAAAREIYERAIKQGHGGQVSVWLAYANLERVHGSTEGCRKILRRAVQYGSDDPASACQALLRFERDLGSLDDLTDADRWIKAKLALVADRAAKIASKEAEATAAADKKAASKRPKRRRDTTEDTGDGGGSIAPPRPDNAPAKRPRKAANPEQHAAAANNTISATDRASAAAVAANAIGPEQPDQQGPVVPDVETYKRSVFVKNLDFRVTGETLQEVFGVCGEIKEVRLVKNHFGKSKGFAYIEFAAEAPVAAALAMDRHTDARTMNRPIFVNKCEDKSQGGGAPTPFKHTVGLETKKLFVSGLDFTLSNIEVKNYFKTFGAIIDVRLPTKPNGQMKGLAFIEFEDEQSAKAAVLQGNGYALKGRPIKVEFSNPPKRDDQKRDDQSGGGNGGGGGGGGFQPRPRAAARSAFQPRTLTKKPRLTHTSRTGPGFEPDPNKPVVKPTPKGNAYFASLFAKK